MKKLLHFKTRDGLAVAIRSDAIVGFSTVFGKDDLLYIYLDGTEDSFVVVYSYERLCLDLEPLL
jgi:hypothetical protein